VLSSTLLLAGACGLLWAMQTTTPNYTRLLGAIESRGASGELVRGRSLALRVDGIELAHALNVPRPGGARVLDSGGIWLIVHASANAIEKPERIAAAAVEASDGTRYLQSDRPGFARGLLAAKDLQPDVPEQGDLVFELPADALAGADLLVSAKPFGLAPLDSVLRIHLDLDRDALKRRIASIPDSYALRQP
jgi:hypothetical protein